MLKRHAQTHGGRGRERMEEHMENVSGGSECFDARFFPITLWSWAAEEAVGGGGRGETEADIGARWAKEWENTLEHTHTRSQLIEKADEKDIVFFLKTKKKITWIQQMTSLCPLRVSPTGRGVPPGGGRPAVGLLPVPPWLFSSEGTPEHAGKDDPLTLGAEG